MAILKQSTVYNRQFLMVESADHITPLTGATVTVTLAKNTTAPAGAAGAVAELGTGLYYIALTVADTNTAGDLGFTCTAASGDPTTFIDQVRSQVFTDLSINANGQVLIAAPVKQGVAVVAFPFLMTTGNPPAPLTGATVTCQRSLGVAGFAPCATPTATEIASGWYGVPLAGTDTNAPFIAFRATAPGANDQDILIPTYP